MNFQVVARDNRANGGGINTATSAVTIVGSSGPFAITSPNSSVSIQRLTNFNVTWNVLGSSAQAANVKISLSTDGGTTFPTVLAANTPNDRAHKDRSYWQYFLRYHGYKLQYHSYRSHSDPDAFWNTNPDANAELYPGLDRRSRLPSGRGGARAGQLLPS
jgi:hypothetical protein